MARVGVRKTAVAVSLESAPLLALIAAYLAAFALDALPGRAGDDWSVYLVLIGFLAYWPSGLGWFYAGRPGTALLLLFGRGALVLAMFNTIAEAVDDPDADGATLGLLFLTGAMTLVSTVALAVHQIRAWQDSGAANSS